jgi:hypothetical protein
MGRGADENKGIKASGYQEIGRWGDRETIRMIGK